MGGLRFGEKGRRVGVADLTCLIVVSLSATTPENLVLA